jgi:hypothetical protein
MVKIILVLICTLILPLRVIADQSEPYAHGADTLGETGSRLAKYRIQQDDTIIFTNPISTTVVKRKKPVTVRWKGIQEGTVYYLELFKGGIYQQQIAELEDVSSYEWTVSKEINGGDDYQLRLVNSRFFGDYTMTEKFRIKNRIPRAFWVLPATAGAAGLYFLIVWIANSGPDPEVDDLPAPIEPY